MPTYEYRCELCGNRFERFQSITDAPVHACPACGGAVQRLISGGAGFFIRGSGGEASLPGGETARTRCGRDQTCCGRSTPCDTPACD